MSIDAIEEKNEYIRFPTRWKTIVENLNVLDQTPPNINVRITTTVMALNIDFIGELIRWKSDQNFKKIQTDLAPGDVDLNILHFPIHLSVQILSAQEKREIEKKLLDTLNWSIISQEVKMRLLGLIKFMYEKEIEPQFGSDAFKEYLGLLDKQRGLDSQKLFSKTADIRLG